MKQSLPASISRSGRGGNPGVQAIPRTANSIPSFNQGEPRVMNGQPILLRQVERENESGLPIWKRALDFAFILALLTGIVLLGAFVALLIKFGSRGPVLFYQRRVGYRGREFTCLK